MLSTHGLSIICGGAAFCFSGFGFVILSSLPLSFPARGAENLRAPRQGEGNTNLCKFAIRMSLPSLNLCARGAQLHERIHCLAGCAGSKCKALLDFMFRRKLNSVHCGSDAWKLAGRVVTRSVVVPAVGSESTCVVGDCLLENLPDMMSCKIKIANKIDGARNAACFDYCPLPMRLFIRTNVGKRCVSVCSGNVYLLLVAKGAKYRTKAMQCGLKRGVAVAGFILIEIILSRELLLVIACALRGTCQDF